VFDRLLPFWEATPFNHVASRLYGHQCRFSLWIQQSHLPPCKADGCSCAPFGPRTATHRRRGLALLQKINGSFHRPLQCGSWLLFSFRRSFSSRMFLLGCRKVAASSFQGLPHFRIAGWFALGFSSRNFFFKVQIVPLLLHREAPR